MNRLMKLIREGIRSIGVNFSVDPITGMPAATPVFQRSAEPKTANEILALLVELSKKDRMVVAFDEFQEALAREPALGEERTVEVLDRARGGEVHDDEHRDDEQEIVHPHGVSCPSMSQ